MIRALLQTIMERTEGARGVSVVALDGISIDSISDGVVPLDSLAAEMSAFVKTVRSSSEELLSGDVEQLSLMTTNYTTLFSSVTSEYYLLFVVSPETNAGRARFELQRVRHALREELL